MGPHRVTARTSRKTVAARPARARPDRRRGKAPFYAGRALTAGRLSPILAGIPSGAPMSRPTRPDRKAEPPSPRDRILQAAARLICQPGYDAASTEARAPATGRTKAGLFHHPQTQQTTTLHTQ